MAKKQIPVRADAKPRKSRTRVLLVTAITLAVLLIAVGVAFLVMYLTGNRPIAQTDEEKAVIGTCGGMEIQYEELRYVTLSYRDILENTYGKGIWDNPETAEQYYGELYDTVMSVLRNNYAILAACRNYQINYEDSALSDAVQKEIDGLTEALGGRKEYVKQLREYYLSDHLLRFTLLAEQAENELFLQIRDFIGSLKVGDTVYPFFGDFNNPNDYAEFYKTYLTEEDADGTRVPSGNMIPVDYLYIQNDAGEDPDDNLALAERYREQLLGEDPGDRQALLSSILGSDANCTYTGVGPYYVTKGAYTETFWRGVSVLENEGDVSDVIVTPSGYYVAVRTAFEESTLLTQIPTLMKEYQSGVLESYIEEIRSGLKVELNDYGKSLNLLDIRMPE